MADIRDLVSLDHRVAIVREHDGVLPVPVAAWGTVVAIPSLPAGSYLIVGKTLPFGPSDDRRVLCCRAART